MKKEMIKLTTAQFAKLHRLNKRTLHYYDDIGLFSPVYKGENNYRYYDYHQSIQLENILMLKELNMSIDEIKRYLSNPNAVDFIKIADDKIEQIDQEIIRLKQTKKILAKRKEQLLEVQSISDLEVKIVECKERYLLVSNKSLGQYDVKDIFEHLQQVWDKEQYKIGCGSYIDINKIKAGDFDHYDGLFTPLQNKVSGKNVLLMHSGRYLCGYVKGNWERINDLYDKMLSFADKRKLDLTGYAFELGINELAISSIDDYVTKILIKISD